MIAGLIGTVHKTTADAVLLDVGGVIYRVQSSTRTIADLDDTGSRVHLFTHLVVREDAMTLFGFLSEAELIWFQTLITVNGVGPRLACAVLSTFAPEQLIKAISEEDVSLLSTVSGVGKRTASRILLDLRGKLPQNLDLPSVLQIEDTDTIAALRALGYTAAESQTAVSRLSTDPAATPEERVIAALRQVGTPI